MGLLVIVVTGSLLLFFRNSCRGYACLSFADRQNFREIEQVENTNISYSGTLTKGSIHVRLEAYLAPTQDVAERFTQAKVMQLQGLFEVARSPYPGVLSNEIVCEDKFKPVVKETSLSNGLGATIITGYLNDRLQYGICLDDQIAYIGRTAMLYCNDQKKWYYFEAITKKSDPKANADATHLIQSLKCQKPF